ncbi:MAG: hypothetical protein JWM11_6959 [Planctomycetaceae bacterium]|nr:hypothetical protein [Planctomycetaceae bacterium]
MPRLKRICLALLFSGVCVAVQAAPPVGKTVYTNKAKFRIPYNFKAEEMRELRAREVRLYVSTDLGARWQPVQTQVLPQNAPQGKFPFQAQGEGEYWFCVRTLDVDNRLHPADADVASELQVIVDTTLPELTLSLRQVAPGRVQLSWKAKDEYLDPARLRLEYAQQGAGGWQAIPVVPKAADSTEWNVPRGGIIAVRGTVGDLAGNLGQAEARVQVAPGKGTGQEGPDFRDPVAGADPLSNSQAGTTLPRGVPSVVQYGQPNANRAKWPDSIGQSDLPSGRASAPPSERVAQRPPSGFASMQQGGAATGASNATDGFSTTSVPPGFQGQDAAATAVPRHDPAARVVNQRQFQIGYRIEEVGPSGISSVEMFITQDNGATWYRYGEDPDKRSPFVVNVPREGVYGFTLLVRSGVGLAADPPQPGERPSIVVNVDETAPRVQILPAEQGRGPALNKLLIRWTAQDENLAERPIALWYGTNPNGPWQPISAGIENTGSYVWPLPQGVGSRLFFRIEARDQAGNVQRLDTVEPLLIDLSKPTARIIDVEATADSRLMPSPQ